MVAVNTILVEGSPMAVGEEATAINRVAVVAAADGREVDGLDLRTPKRNEPLMGSLKYASD